MAAATASSRSPDAARPKRGPKPAPPSPLRRTAEFVNRKTLRVEHLLNYKYSEEVRRIATRLCLTPPESHGAQILRSHELRFAPLPYAAPAHTDRFGNRIVEVRHEAAKSNLTIVAEIAVDTACHYDRAGLSLPMPILPDAEAPADAFREPTPLTEPGDDLREAAAQKRSTRPADSDPFDFAFALSRKVYQTMRYTPGSTTVKTTAPQAWAARRGVCQDYAHVLLALLRECGTPARYVSGFLPGEGAMHAWVEALLPARPDVPQDGPDAWYALDPTHDCWVTERYVTVAVGRDYADVSPTSGTFYGRAPGDLSHHSRVAVETQETAAL